MKELIQLVNQSISLNKYVPLSIEDAIDNQLKLIDVEDKIRAIASSLNGGNTDTYIGRVFKSRDK